MMDNFFLKSRTFRRVLISYLLLVLLVLGSTAIRSYSEALQEAGKVHVMECRQAVSNAVWYFESYVEQIQGIAKRLQQTAWINKYCSNSSTFEEEFTTVRRMELVKEIQLYMGGVPGITKLAILFPDRDTCVSSGGWLNLADFFSLFSGSGTKEALHELERGSSIFQTQVIVPRSSGDSIILACSLDNIAKPRAYALFFISKSNLSEHARLNLVKPLSQFRIFNRETSETVLTLYPSEKKAQKRTEESTVSGYLNWKYEAAYDSAAAALPLQTVRKILQNMALLISLGLPLSVLLSFITYRPLGRILKRVVKTATTPLPDKPVSDYCLIEDSFTSLEEENAQMRKNAEYYEKIVRDNVIKSLLRGNYNEATIVDQLGKYRISLSDNYLHQVLLITGERLDGDIESEAQAEALLMNALSKECSFLEGCRYELMESVSKDVVILLEYQDENHAGYGIKLLHRFEFCCAEHFDCRPLVCMGTVQKGLWGISRSYQQAMESRLHIPYGWNLFGADSLQSGQYYYPLEWENQLVNALRAGNRQSAENILTKIREENEKRNRLYFGTRRALNQLLSMIAETLLRVLKEQEMEEDIILQNMELFFVSESDKSKWKYLMLACGDLCKGIYLETLLPSTEQGRRIVAYVEEHFADCNLSLRSLEDEFGVSAPTISKAFKSSVGDTFFNYLYHFRMNKACELLKQTNGTMGHIAKLVGYENDFSFKRAFVRFAGVRPKEYMETHKKQILNSAHSL